MIGTLLVGLAAAWLIGRWLGVLGNRRTLIGVGIGICGPSAIAAVTPVIGAVGVDVAFALFAGTAVNDMSSVVATATTYGRAAAS